MSKDKLPAKLLEDMVYVVEKKALPDHLQQVSTKDFIEMQTKMA